MDHLETCEGAAASGPAISGGVVSRVARAKRIGVSTVIALTAMLFVFSSAPASYADSAGPAPLTYVAHAMYPAEEPDPPDAPATAAVVTFDATGGTVSPASVTIDFGAKYGTLPTPKRAGYTFTGWFTAKSGGQQVTPSTKVPSEPEITLYAQWSARTYTVNFDPRSGTVKPTSKTVKFGSSYGTLPNPDRYGYNFAGWYTSKSGGDLITASTKMTQPGTQTLYARWTGKSHTVKLVAQGGKVSPASKKVQYGSTYGTWPTATRAGYALQGWYTSASGGTRVYSSTQVTTLSNETLYAQWTSKSYKVTFDPNGGSVGKKSKSVKNGATYGSLPTPSRPNYSFSGWYTATSGGKKIVSSTAVKLSGPTTLYARWSKKSNHWVDVDLTYQTLKMMDGNKVVATFPISSGKLSTPSPSGTFRVYAQTADQSMGGYKHVKWCTWFYPNVAIHTAYWHNEFGKKAVSHGCINMREANAKTIYYWLKIGSTVYVHGKWKGYLPS